MSRMFHRSRGSSLLAPGCVIAIKRCLYLGVFGSTLLLIFYAVIVSQTDFEYDYNRQLTYENIGGRIKAPAVKETSASSVEENEYPKRVKQNSTNAAANVHMLDEVLISNASSVRDFYPRVIPHTLHQTWDDIKVPGQVEAWIKSWRRHNPDINYTFWTDAGARQLIETHFVPRFSQLYDEYPHKINRADVRRLFILYLYGGIFSDLDVECLKRLDKVLSEHSCILSQEPEEHQALHYDYKHPGYATPAFMACSPKHPFFKFVLQLLPAFAVNARKLPWNDNILNSTGPMFISMALDMYKKINKDPLQQVFVAPSAWFMPTYDVVHKDEFIMKCEKPEEPLSDKQLRVCNDLRQRDFNSIIDDTAYTNHHWLHSWAYAFIPRGYVSIVDIMSNITVVDR